MMAIHKQRKTGLAHRWKLHLLTTLWCALALGAFAAGIWLPHGASNADDNAAASHSALEQMCTVALPHHVPDKAVQCTGFTVHFNRLRHVPNYVAYRLTRAHIESKPAAYSGKFFASDAAEGCPQPHDYAKSGYQRGHMAPAADMKWSGQALRQSYAMINICPQRRELNAGAWLQLEEKVREWAERDDELVVITGPMWKNRTAPIVTIGESKVAVPTHFFKVVAAPHARPMRAIAFVLPNGEAESDLTKYAVSVDEVERLTGFNFFSSLPSEEQHRMESNVDTDSWFQF